MRLLCWNVQWCRGLDGKVDPSRIADEARRLADPDVLCFQEVAANFPELAGSDGRDEVEALSRLFPGYEAVFACGVDVPGAGGGRSRFGNLLLSRLPVGRVLRHALPWPGSRTPSMPRAAAEAVIEAPFGPLRVITTHLEYYSSGHRAAQIERLRDLHADACAPRPLAEEGGPFRSLPWPRSAIVCGDFNMPPDDPLRARFIEPFVEGYPPFVDAWEALHPGEPHPPTFRVHERDEGQSPYCCDYFFATGDLKPRLRSIRVDGATRASDHQPVLLELG
jgi:endonuclease/exonuclease/phosphatase family metal-dependent hydrolase